MSDACMQNIDVPLSEEWLKAAGFKWHQFERQPCKHWLLWLGAAVDVGMFSCFEDLGIEVAQGSYAESGEAARWFCWLRDDAGGRYHRFIHLRHICTPRDLVVIIGGITGIEFDPFLCRYGSMVTPERAAMQDAADRRLDRVMMRSHGVWASTEKDDTRGGALPEHMEAAVKAGVAK